MANSSSDPAIPSAKATQASFPDATIIPLRRFSTERKDNYIRMLSLLSFKMYYRMA